MNDVVAEKRITEITISGGGPAGMMAALALSAKGYRTVLLGPETDKNDRRTTALMMPAIRFLENLGVWSRIAPEAAPLASMRIVDATSRLIRSPAVTFRAGEIDEIAFGYNIPNAALNQRLAEAVEANCAIERITLPAIEYRNNDDHVTITLAGGETLHTRLVIAADGRNSAAREAAGIRTRRWSYPQTAVVLSFAHDLEHGNISTEFHTEEGPFTQVPLKGKRSSLVWVVNPGRAETLLTLDDGTLSQRIEDMMQSMLGKVTLDIRPQAWPLSGMVPLSFASKRTILIGEAAHVFPPIGAQGLNLGTRDVETLIKAIANDPSDPGSDPVIRAYDRGRRPDILARTGSVDALNRSLLSPMLPAQIARGVGLEMLRSFAPLRAFFMREGLRPGSGFSQFLPKLSKSAKQ
ncbi:UbiH/UbiF family hydroxylase [Brucella thiophenivorans]|uniref:Ubiquinone biosynthesis hydroxylase, UbiH/UbiF/VisC/COQ6 family protein n=1 Tax=Brucella thiophenivorans TaxID=571255 RepID=A0A256FJ44_9HYPH|nr:UbiH/UbiF family hydroxylase [Brucella thiophenivorans]OYR14875.1 ubiquinone biosynthesis hydroxylase, UbiH/UbiF/VisC/COQ6 family protein [Brucella thiophenivorans]